MKPLTVLVTGSDAPGFVDIVKSLRKSDKYLFKIIGTDWVDNLKGRKFADVHYVLPDNKKVEDYAYELFKVCKNEHVDVVLPIRTGDLLPLIRHVDEFESIGVNPITAFKSEQLLNIVNDKYRFLDYLENVLNLPVMNYQKVTDLESLVSASNDLGYPKSPVCIKPSYATGARGFRILTSVEDMRNRLINDKPTGLYMTRAQFLDLLSAGIPEYLVMEYLQEPEFTVDVLCYKGQTLAIVPRKRLKMRCGITEKGIIEKLPEEIMDEIKLLIAGLGATGCVGVQLRYSSIDHRLHFIEMNPRLQGTTILSVASGINFPELMVEMALGICNFKVNFQEKVNYGLKIERHYTGAYAPEEKIITVII